MATAYCYAYYTSTRQRGASRVLPNFSAFFIHSTINFKLSRHYCTYILNPNEHRDARHSPNVWLEPFPYTSSCQWRITHNPKGYFKSGTNRAECMKTSTCPLPTVVPWYQNKKFLEQIGNWYQRILDTPVAPSSGALSPNIGLKLLSGGLTGRPRVLFATLLHVVCRYRYRYALVTGTRKLWATHWGSNPWSRL